MKNLRSAAIDAGAIIGVGLLSYGAWLIYPPAGFLVCGALALAGAVFASKGGV